MHQKSHFGYTEDETLQALEMPYKGGELSMVVLLPRKVDGLPELEAWLSPERLTSLLSKLPYREVITTVPRFKLEAGFGLKPTLEAIGMKRAFSPEEADFSGISTKEKLYVSAVIHKAFVDVNETGTEAAAATAIGMGALAARREPTPVFRADHPFLFVIRDMRSGAILFLGRVVNPTG
jgi:serpin B